MWLPVIPDEYVFALLEVHIGHPAVVDRVDQRPKLRVKVVRDRLALGQRVTLDEFSGPFGAETAIDWDVLAVHEAIERLAELDPRQARIVELRWFGGLTVPEVAEALIRKRMIEIEAKLQGG